MPSPEPIEYELLSGNIHRIKFLEPSRAAVDAWMAKTRAAFSMSVNKPPVLLLVDSSVGLVPLSYGFQQARETIDDIKRYDQLPAYVAVLHQEIALIGMIERMSNLITGNLAITWRFFHSHQSDAAIAWLQSQAQA